MKKIVIVTTIYLFILTSCDPLYHVGMKNNSDVPIYFISPDYCCFSLYPDTIIPCDVEIGTLYWSNEKLSSKASTLFDESIAYWDIDFFFYHNDMVSFYIFNADTVDFYSWDTIIKNNLVLQRYDISREDFENLEETCTSKWLCFPPTKDMKHIHMWPPYGTYDEHGQKILDK